MDTTTLTAFDQNGFQSLLESRDEPACLVEQRRASWDVFRQLPWPSRADEQWMRTDIRMFRLERYFLSSTEPATASLPPAQLSEGVSLAGRTTALNSHNIATSLDDSWQQRGVLFGSLSALCREHQQLLSPYMVQPLVPPDVDKFAALNKAFWTAGTVLYVPRGVVVQQPFHIRSIIGPDGVDLSRLVVILDEGAEATVLCETASTEPDGDGLHCGGIEMYVRQGANLRFVMLQDWSRRTWHFAHQYAALQQDASLQWTAAALGSRLSKVNQTVQLAGPGADCQVNGVLFTEGKQHLAYHTLQHHIAPRCHSDFLYKGALQDHSRTVWRGMIKVDPAAQKTDGYQRNDNLLLGADVRADSIPGLEIEADDVRCSHGSTTGRVDDELVFYLQSRGLTRREAVRMVVTGFFQHIFDRITIESVRDSLSSAIARRVREYH